MIEESGDRSTLRMFMSTIGAGVMGIVPRSRTTPRCAHRMPNGTAEDPNMMQLRRTGWIAFLTVLLIGIAPLHAATLPARLGVYRIPVDLEAETGFSPKGALLYQVIPTSSAGKAGLQAGDVITAIDGLPIRDFADLAERIGAFDAGEEATVDFLRDDVSSDVKVKLSAWVGETTSGAQRATLEFLRKLKAGIEEPGPALSGEIVDLRWQVGDRKEAVEELELLIARLPNQLSFRVLLLEYLKLLGRYDRFVELAQRLAKDHPDYPPLLLSQADALLARGNTGEAERLAGQVALGQHGSARRMNSITAEALQIWSLARLRQGKPLADPALGAALDGRPWRRPELEVVEYWRRNLDGARPYELAEGKGVSALEFRSASVLFGLAPYKMRGISIRVNDVEVPLAIVDTGASHTLLSTSTAEAAKVRIGTNGRTAAGSLAFTARAGFVEKLQIGDLVLRNVPVNVGNPPPLVMTAAKAALGVDLMHHLRFTLDYANDKVLVEPAWQAKDAAPKHPDAVWDIPLYTFSDHCMAQARVADGAYARTLIDSGNFAQTLVWPTWAKQNMLNHPGPVGSLLVYSMTDPQRMLKGLRLGDRTLPAWPVMDMPPITLDGIDLLDLLMGHDLLSQYKVTIDMQRRRLRLLSPGEKFAPPVGRKPIGI